MKFEISTLETYEDSDFINELVRVSKIVSGKLTMSKFDKYSKVHSSTVWRRFGGWGAALEKAGLAETVSAQARKVSDEDIILLAKEVSTKINTSILTQKQFTEHTGIGQKAILKRFGSWKSVLDQAGLVQDIKGKIYSDEECYENLLNVWMHYGRQPKYAEMKQPPSVVGAKAYMRWVSWRKALHAFVAYVNSETEELKSAPQSQELSAQGKTQNNSLGPRDIPLGLRYKILQRDCFKCTLCGSSPATIPTIILHIDHIVPYSKGGPTKEENLRVLCSSCNLGKSNRIEV